MYIYIYIYTYIYIHIYMHIYIYITKELPKSRAFCQKRPPDTKRISHICMSHVSRKSRGKYMNESCLTHGWVTSHVWMSNHTYEWVTQRVHFQKRPCDTGLIPHICICVYIYTWIYIPLLWIYMFETWRRRTHSSYMHESCLTHEYTYLSYEYIYERLGDAGLIPHICMSCVSHCGWVTSHVWTCRMQGTLPQETLRHVRHNSFLIYIHESCLTYEYTYKRPRDT